MYRHLLQRDHHSDLTNFSRAFPNIDLSTGEEEEKEFNKGMFPDVLSSPKGASNPRNSKSTSDISHLTTTELKSECLKSNTLFGKEAEQNHQHKDKEKVLRHDNSSADKSTFSTSIKSKVCSGISSRYDFPIQPSKMVLLVIDIQEFLSQRNHCTSDHSSSYLFDVSLPNVLPNIERLATTTRSCSYGGQVIFTYLEALTDDCRDISLDYKLSGPSLASLPGPSNPAKFLSQLTPDRKHDILIPKTSCSVFVSTNIHYVLGNLDVEQIVICGQLTNQCVESAARDAADLGYLVTVVSDACAALSSDDHEKGLYGMKGFARIITTEQVMQEIYEAKEVSMKNPIVAKTPTHANPYQNTLPMAEKSPTENTFDSSTINETSLVNSSLVAQGSSETHSNPSVSAIVEESFSTEYHTNIETVVHPEPGQKSFSTEPPELTQNVYHVSSTGKESNSPSATLETSPADSATEPQITPTITNKLSIKTVNDFELPSPSIGAICALLQTLQLLGVKFLRVVTIDISNSIRCKAIPIKHILNHPDPEANFTKITSFAEVCLGGMPSYADCVISGTGLDASRVLYVQPDLSTLRVLPYAPSHALVFGSAQDPVMGHVSPFCSRSLLSRVLLMAKEDFGVTFQVGAEIEFQLFSSNDPTGAVDSSLFANSTTLNEQEVFMNDLIDQLEKQHVEIELVHSESASGQLEVVLRYQKNVMKIADNVILARETIISCAKKHKMKAIFLPKANPNQAGNGLHLHFSFIDLKAENSKENAFGSKELIGEVSAKGKSFMEGLLRHFPALLALSIPTTNSFRRFGPGCWTGHKIGWAVEDKEAPLRVCLTPFTNEPCHVEMKLSDSTANIYLELAAILSAGLDGISHELALRLPLSSVSNEDWEDLPDSLEKALTCLENDDVLVSVLGSQMIQSYCAVKRAEISNSQHDQLTSDEAICEETKAALKKA